MEIQIKIKMENEAFENIEGAEAARILRELANKIEEQTAVEMVGGRLSDVNGNKVGTWDVT